MNSFIHTLNHLGGTFSQFALAMLVQSSLLMVALFLLDLVLRKKVRAVVRYPLWLLVLVKLALPPSFAAPTGLAYWLPESKIARPPRIVAPPVVVHYSEAATVELPVLQTIPESRPRLQISAMFLLAWLAIALGLVAGLVRRSHSVARAAARATPATHSPEDLLEACRQQLGIKQRVRLKLSANTGSPAVCGVWRPLILIPQTLVDKLTPLQMRAVLFHELAHIKRGDIWMNYAQTLLQILYWWHPLLWLANAQIRRVREQAVDERVMVEMGGEAEAYPATLLEVAKLAARRPLTALGLVGIVESKSALAQRIRRLLDSPAPKSAKPGFARLAVVALVGAVLLPMARGQRPARPAPAVSTRPDVVSITVKFAELTDPALEAISLGDPTVTGPNGHRAWVLPPEDDLIERMQGQADTSILFAPSVTTRSGQQGQIKVTQSQDFKGNVIEVGPVCDLLAEVSGDWIDLTVTARVTEFGEIVPDQLNGLQLRPKKSDSNGKTTDAGAVYSVNATGYIIHEAGTARVSVADEGFVVLQNPELKSINGNRILVVVSPRIVRETASASSPDLNPVSLAGSSSSATRPREETKVLPTPLAKSAQAQRAGPSPMDNASERVPGILVRPGQNPRIETNRLEVAKNLFEEIRIPILGFDHFLGDDLLSEPDSRQSRVPVLGDLPFVGRLFRSDTNSISGPRERTGSKPNKTIPGTQQLETRVFKFDPKTFFEEAHRFLLDAGLSDIEIFGHSNDWKGSIIRKFIESLGASHVPPNTIFYSDGTGVLMLRATRDELERVQKSIERFNALRQKEAASPSPAASARVGKQESQPHAVEEVVVAITAQRIYLKWHPVTLEVLKTQLAEARGRNPNLRLLIRADRDAPVDQVAGVFEMARSLNIEPFATKPSETIQLETRVFRVSPATLVEGLKNTSSLPLNPGTIDSIQDSIRRFFTAAGVNVQPPNALFFNDRTGVLMVRATLKEMDIVEKVLETLNYRPPQVTIEARFVEMPTEVAVELGLDLPRPDAASSPLTRILTAAQAPSVLRKAEQHAGVDILSAPRITTLSGRQAQIQVVETRTVVAGIDPKALAPPGVQSTNGRPAQPYLTSQVLCGPKLDVVPAVDGDGYTIHLTALPQVTEFIRYDTTLKGPNEARIWMDGQQRNVPLPRPVIRTRQTEASVDVYDGQTLVLGSPRVTEVSQQSNGQSVTNAIPEDPGKRLLVFITPTLIDPAGNPIHASGNETWSDKTPPSSRR